MTIVLGRRPTGGGGTGTVTVAPSATQSIGMSNLGNTSGTTGVATGPTIRFLFAGGNNITLSQSINGASGTITISAPATSSLAVSSPLSLSTSGSTITIAGPAQYSGGMSTIGNTSGDTGTVTGRVVLAGGNNVTLSGSTNAGSMTITISAGTAAGGSFSAGVSNLGNTAGSTGVSGTRLVLVGTNNISLSQSTDASGATVSISGASGGGAGFSAGVSTGGNTAGSTGVTGSQLVLVGSSPVSLSQSTGANGGTVTINAPATSSLAGASGVSLSTSGSTISIIQTSGGLFVREFNPFLAQQLTMGQQGQGTLHVQPFQLNADLQMDRVELGVAISNESNSSNSVSVSGYFGIYTKNASTLSLLTSISTATNFSGSGTAGSYSLYGGQRWQTAALTTTLSQGDYYAAMIQRTTTGGGAGHSVSQMLLSKITHGTFSGWSGQLGISTANSNQLVPGLGTYSVTTSGMPTSIGFTELTGTGTLVQQLPVFALRSGTV